jgi:UDP-N-acetylmuramoyl-L-alanyl-D-glutamate--2,6-diaminopimelate ligase
LGKLGSRVVDVVQHPTHAQFNNSVPPVLGALMQLPDTHPCAGLPVASICTDSRQAQAGAVFFARAGEQHDGRHFIAQAAQRGAVAAVVADASQLREQRLPIVEAADFDAALAVASANFFGHPSKQLRLLGVTGTNGKTTVAHLCSTVLDELSRCGVLGTLGVGRPGALQSCVHTTPELNITNAVLAQCVRANCEYAVMEVSSHGISQRRIEGLVFDTALYTNLSRDHLDYHGDMDTYAGVKARLFEQPALRLAVVNADDPYAERMVRDTDTEVVRYSLAGSATNSGVNARLAQHGGKLTLALEGRFGRGTIRSQLLGRFNAYNLLACATVLAGLGLAMDEICARLGRVPPAPGRMQWLGGGTLPTVVIDYSHTPDALDKALTAVRASVSAKLWCVFGCGGERDTGKRPQMGRIAEQHADYVIVTDDNPRNEPSEQIINQILDGMRAPGTVWVEADRAKAIDMAVAASGPQDVVLIAGKGHEPYQERDGVRSPFNDLEVAGRALALKGCTNA